LARECRDALASRVRGEHEDAIVADASREATIVEEL
jgi:hypothetical protein